MELQEISLIVSPLVSTSASSFLQKPKVDIDFESSVKHWLAEMETMYEAEVMTTLQSKSLATDLTRQVTNMADTTSYTVKKLHQKTKIISLEFSKLCKHNKIKPGKHVGPLVQSLIGHVTEFIYEYTQTSSQNKSADQRTEEKCQRQEPTEEEVKTPEANHEMITDFRKPEPETVEMKKEMEKKKTKEEEVLESCENLRRLTASGQLDHEKVESEVSVLGQKFREVVDGLLESHIQALIRVLEEPRTELTLRTALSALTSLGLESNQLGLVVSKCGGIRALLAICLEARATAVRVSAHRALATVCCVAETIRQFEQAGGVEIISDILADENRSEAELSEASAVIAQITAPWVQDNHSVEGLSQFLNSLVTSLTRIVGKYKSCETLLLSSAALANLTFMEPRTVWPLLEKQTAKILLSAVRRQGSKVSVFIMEQAATIIANMSSVPECRKHLAEQRAVVALLCFLEIHQSPLQNAPEVAAAERVLQKSAIALSRLCSDTVVAKQVVELQGVNRLVRLCKEEKERNHSDGVLVACLAALRKIVANCGTEALQELNAMELVEPRLLDSFLLYSSKQESYV
ncbi:hypothetical protein RUM43_006404 [Polyplax serrata]|uniref:Protein inscuteable homologue C-terminal domain-containing protein n=1 Tax=Polyplax serrata TaxID=468196 RepID=A0AAN8PL82_POLSC